MISFLTGTRMIGKTTWLKELVSQMQEREIPLWGFITPAIFEDGFKTGIDTVVFPSGEHFTMATLTDKSIREPVRPTGPIPLEKQAVMTVWNFSDDAMRRINENLATGRVNQPEGSVLLADELGPLEMIRGEGLVEAVAILDAGDFENAIVVIRPELMEMAVERWGNVSEGGCETIYPDEMPAFLK